MTQEEHHFFLMGWNRAKRKINHTTRRQFQKALNKNAAEAFVAGWYLSKILKLFKSIGFNEKG